MEFQCVECGASLSAPGNMAGRVGKCPKCGARFVAPTATTDAPHTPAPKQRQPGPPATDRQKEYARELGVDFPHDITRKEISALIDAAVERRDEQRYRRLEALDQREQAAYEEIRAELLAEIDQDDCRLSTATPEQMVDELENRGLAAALVTVPSDDIDDLGAETVPVSVMYSDSMTEDDAQTIFAMIGLAARCKRPTEGRLGH